jgi:hypothetical protein
MSQMGENIQDKLRQIFGKIPDFSILEEKIDLDLQLEYFECSKNAKEKLDPDQVVGKKEDIFNLELDKEIRKKRFAELASVEDVEVYRTIEKYVHLGIQDLRSWAILSLQESRMLLESGLLNENQVFLSTGLGGKEDKLRYFIVLLHKEKIRFTATQQQVVRNEFEIMLRQQEGEIEKISYYQKYAALLVLLPIDVAIRDTFKSAIRECNLYGDFLRENFIVTNVKELEIDEIEEFINNRTDLNQYPID